MKRILISFDGTGSEPSDADEEYDRKGERVDAALSNVLKLHLLAGGRLENDRSHVDGQRCLYFSGVGTRGPKLASALSSAFGLQAPDRIRDEGYQALCAAYEPGDSIHVFGFSRGAAIARMLAVKIDEEGVNGERPAITLLGCWDTVAAQGFPDGDPDEEPSSGVLGEDGRIARCVELAWHLVSVDEQRVAFRPTLMGREDRVNELWFAGVHSDVGGSYLDHRLSDVALLFLRDRAAELGVAFLDPADVNYDDLGGDTDITEAHLAQDPDPVNGLLHADDEDVRDSALKRPRRMYVAVDDRITELPVTVNHTVVERLEGNEGYEPEALAALQGYLVRDEDGKVGRS